VSFSERQLNILKLLLECNSANSQMIKSHLKLAATREVLPSIDKLVKDGYVIRSKEPMMVQQFDRMREIKMNVYRITIDGVKAFTEEAMRRGLDGYVGEEQQ